MFPDATNSLVMPTGLLEGAQQTLRCSGAKAPKESQTPGAPRMRGENSRRFNWCESRSAGGIALIAPTGQRLRAKPVRVNRICRQHLQKVVPPLLKVMGGARGIAARSEKRDC